LNFHVAVGEPASSFIRHLSPEPRRAIKKALKALCTESGDIRSLEQELAGYYRVRVGKYRIIFRYRNEATIEVPFVEERSLVYEVFAEQFIKRLKS
jgi:mRNA interferase RelE/StbE